ncbi:protein FAR1-RELATED SEQUENCE 3-like [Silene latifolia]|uniref:protein FAR1-RELATED SEQUENCE 3-like n=1 Tax=Silene latifolia TaxID=37657 RepID=UPI003D770C09
MTDLQMIPFGHDNIEHNGKRKPNEEEFCKDVEAKFTPYVGQEFLEIEQAVTFYKIYAVACGFDVRKYTTKRWRAGEIKSKLLMFVDHFKELAVNRPGFFFNYDVDSDGSLSKAIWADGIARRNYSVFGDAMSFDPTYSTNKYDMSFTPFTGVDNHKRSVTFCGALVAHEDADSFKWVFTRFLDAMGGKEPKYIITDQDPGILKAVPLVFKTARHRYYIEAAEFDAKWEEIGREHNVNNIDWFQEMYAKRKQWVMAHYRDLDIGGVMRTTQRSESENSFFKRFESKSGTLVEFSMRFDSAMDQQRHTQKQIDNCNRHTFHVISTHLAIEVHGAQVYSHKVFEEFQEEAKCSIGTCKSRGFTECGSLEVTTVRDANRDRNYEVTYCPDTLKATCSCRMLERKGILYRHVIWIYSSNGVKIFPEQCVVKRWCKDARLSKMLDCNGEATEDVDIIDGKQITMSVM